MATLTLLFVRHGSKDRRGSRTRRGQEFARDHEAVANALGAVLDAHCARMKVRADAATPLSSDGRRASETLAVTLDRLDVHPDVVITSAFAHALETAECLGKSPVLADTLLPVKGVPLSLTEVSHRCPDEARTIVVVGHENRLSQLVAAATGERIRPLDALDVVCVTASGWPEVLRGQGELAWRYPVRAHQVKTLGTKLSSKMTVATFLAGFTFTALHQTVTTDGAFDVLIKLRNANLRNESVLEAILPALLCREALPLLASILLAVALVLFIGAVYIYDRLSMPAGFWNVSRAGRGWLGVRWGDELFQRDGPVYLHMVRAWSCVFTPAVCLAAAGLLLIAWSEGTWLLAALFVGIGVLTTLWCHWFQPRLGVD